MNKKGKIGGMIIGIILGYFLLWLAFLHILSLIVKEPSPIIAAIALSPFIQLISTIIGGYIGFKYIPI